MAVAGQGLTFWGIASKAEMCPIFIPNMDFKCREDKCYAENVEKRQFRKTGKRFLARSWPGVDIFGYCNKSKKVAKINPHNFDYCQKRRLLCQKCRKMTNSKNRKRIFAVWTEPDPFTGCWSCLAGRGHYGGHFGGS